MKLEAVSGEINLKGDKRLKTVAITCLDLRSATQKAIAKCLGAFQIKTK